MTYGVFGEHTRATLPAGHAAAPGAVPLQNSVARGTYRVLRPQFRVTVNGDANYVQNLPGQKAGEPPKP